MTTQATPAAKVAEDIFKGVVWDNLVKAGIAALFTAVPWLNVWPFSSAISYLLTLFSDKIFEAFRLSLDLSIIILLNKEHQEAYEKEALKLKIIAYSYGIDSEVFKEEKERAKKAFAQLVSHIG